MLGPHTPLGTCSGKKVFQSAAKLQILEETLDGCQLVLIIVVLAQWEAHQNNQRLSHRDKLQPGPGSGWPHFC